MYVSTREFTKPGFPGPEAEVSPSRHVSLFVRAALRKVDVSEIGLFDEA